MKTKRSDPKPKFKVGDKVYLKTLWRGVPAYITEDRGCLGYGGRRLYQIRLELEDEHRVFEVPEEELDPNQTVDPRWPPR